jgi:hypothetical protein
MFIASVTDSPPHLPSELMLGQIQAPKWRSREILVANADVEEVSRRGEKRKEPPERGNSDNESISPSLRMALNDDSENEDGNSGVRMTLQESKEITTKVRVLLSSCHSCRPSSNSLSPCHLENQTLAREVILNHFFQYFTLQSLLILLLAYRAPPAAHCSLHQVTMTDSPISFTIHDSVVVVAVVTQIQSITLHRILQN